VERFEPSHLLVYWNFGLSFHLGERPMDKKKPPPSVKEFELSNLLFIRLRASII